MCKSGQKSSSSPTTVLNVGGAICLWLVLTTSAFLSQLRRPANNDDDATGNNSSGNITPLTVSLIFFNNLNIFISMCEICLGLNIDYIQRDYEKLRARYPHGKNEWRACVDYLTAPLTLRGLFDKVWLCKMWSTYALYDPSYQNRESFGFFVDFGNGMSTIPPSLLMNVAIVWPRMVSPLWVGCIGLAVYWQVLYGAIVYVFTFLFNRRYEGKSLAEVCLFVGVSNSLWMIFPPMGMYACVCMLRDKNMDVFQ